MISRAFWFGAVASNLLSTYAFHPSYNGNLPGMQISKKIPVFLSATKDTIKPAQSVIQILLESGDIDGAVSELSQQRMAGSEIASSTYHSIIEACCAGRSRNHHFVKDKSKYRHQESRSRYHNGERDVDNSQLKLAASLLDSMENATVHAYEILISGYARRGRWLDASKLLKNMEERFFGSDDRFIPSIVNKTDKPDYLPSLNIYQTVLSSLANAGQYDRMMSLLTKMRRRGVRPNVNIYNSLMNICAQHRVPRWKEALSLLSQCQREPGINPDLVTYTTAMRACARARKSKKAMEIFRVIKDMGLELDVYCYTTAMNACANDGNWKTALDLMDEMKTSGLSPNDFTYSVAITACGNGGQWSMALELLDQMKSQEMEINTVTYNSAISALAKAARAEYRQQRQFDDDKPITTKNRNDTESNSLWRRALGLMKSMEMEGVRRDVFTYSSAINTCGAAGRWEEAVNLIKEMKGDGGNESIKPNKVTYTSAIVACGNSGQWEAAFDLFNEMKHDGLRPDLVAYNSLIAAGMNANQPEKVFNLWCDICQPNEDEISPDIVTLTEVIATLDRAAGKANREKVDRVFAEAVQRGIILREDSLDSSWDVDLSGMSFPVARAACRFIFRRIFDRVKLGQEKVEDLSLITGASRMREYVRGVLRDELTPGVYCVVPKLEQGTLKVKEKVMMNYINAQESKNG